MFVPLCFVRRPVWVLLRQGAEPAINFRGGQHGASFVVHESEDNVTKRFLDLVGRIVREVWKRASRGHGVPLDLGCPSSEFLGQGAAQNKRVSGSSGL